MIRDRQKVPKFVIAKSSAKTKYLLSKYKKNIEASIIISLLITIILFRLTTNIDVKKYLVEDNTKFEFFEVTEIPPPIEPPEQLKMEEVIEIREEEKTAEDDKINEIIEEIEEMLGEKDSDEQLMLAENGLNNNLLTNSQLTGISGTQLILRKSLANNEGDLNFGRGSYLDNSSGDLEIGKNEAKRRNISVEKTDLNLTVDTPKNETRVYEQTDNREVILGIEGKPAKVLSFSSSTIGTEDYKLWNKIISEMDRLNKGQYGVTSNEIQRSKNGFQLSFNFDDKTRLEIHWRNDGNIWIQIFGKSNKTNMQELQRALGALLRLSFSN